MGRSTDSIVPTKPSSAPSVTLILSPGLKSVLDTTFSSRMRLTSSSVSGSGRRELADRSISQPLEKLMDARKPYQSPGTPEKTLLPCEGAPRVLLCAAPVLAGGDVTGAVGLLTEDRAACPEDAQCKAVAVAAAFLAKQMEE